MLGEHIELTNPMMWKATGCGQTFNSSMEKIREVSKFCIRYT